MARVERKSYQPAEDMVPYLHPLTPWNKQVQLPNLEEITDPVLALKMIAWHKQYHHYYNAAVKIPGETHSTYVNLYLMVANSMFGGWDGTGLVVTCHNSDVGRVFKFALCLHEKTEEGHSPNHGRGWHPGHCKHCNMDMSVDSGD